MRVMMLMVTLGGDHGDVRMKAFHSRRLKERYRPVIHEDKIH